MTHNCRDSIMNPFDHSTACVARVSGHKARSHTTADGARRQRACFCHPLGTTSRVDSTILDFGRRTSELLQVNCRWFFVVVVSVTNHLQDKLGISNCMIKSKIFIPPLYSNTFLYALLRRKLLRWFLSPGSTPTSFFGFRPNIRHRILSVQVSFGREKR